MEVKITILRNVTRNPNLLSTYYKPDVVLLVSFCVVLIS